MELSTVHELLEQAGDDGKIFSVEFKKKSGELRTMRCKLSRYVNKGKVGKGAKYNPSDKGLVFVYDMDAYKHDTPEQSYRSINLEGVTKINGVPIS